MTISSDELMQSYPSDGNIVEVTTELAAGKIKKMRKSIIRKYGNSKLTSKLASPQIVDKTFHSHWRRDALLLVYPNGFGLTIFLDPGVLELNSKPSSQREIENNLELIQEDFFNEGKKVGLEPALFSRSGHIHIEVTKIHPVTVRNFLAEFFNATGLAAGALNEDIYNAIGTGELPDKNKQYLRKAFEKFDAIADPQTQDLPLLVRKAYNIPHRADLKEYRKARGVDRPDKYNAISFSSFDTLGTIEIRSLRPQPSAKSYLKLVKLFVARMQLAEQKRLLGKRVEINQLESLRGNPQAILADFDRYLAEVGFNLKDYREFVLPWWQLEGGEVDQYLASKSLAAKSCRSLL